MAALYLELGRLAVIGETNCDLFLLEKPAPRNAKGGSQATVFKDGLHLMVPRVVTRPEVQHALRAAMLPHVRRIFFGPAEPSRFLCSAEEVYDEAVIESNGWLLYGAKKPDEPHPWTVTRVFGPEGER